MNPEDVVSPKVNVAGITAAVVGLFMSWLTRSYEIASGDLVFIEYLLTAGVTAAATWVAGYYTRDRMRQPLPVNPPDGP